MEIAAYPVPYASPLFPQSTEARSGRGNRTSLSHEQDRTATEERVLQGEVLNGRKNKPGQASSSHLFEQQAHRVKPDLSGLDSSSRYAIQSYLDNDTQLHPLFNTRPLIDEYV